MICHPGEVAKFQGKFLVETSSPSQSKCGKCLTCPLYLMYDMFQMKIWRSHLKYHAYCIWILLREVILVSKILFKGTLVVLKFNVLFKYVSVYSSHGYPFSFLSMYFCLLRIS